MKPEDLLFIANRFFCYSKVRNAYTYTHCRSEGLDEEKDFKSKSPVTGKDLLCLKIILTIVIYILHKLSCCILKKYDCDQLSLFSVHRPTHIQNFKYA